MLVTQRVYRSGYCPPEFLVDHVFLDFELDADRTVVASRLDVRRNPDAVTGNGFRLDGETLELLSLTLDGRHLSAAEYRHDDTGLEIFRVPDVFTVTTEVALCPAMNTTLMGLYSAGDMLCTQCEPEAFRRITFFPDRPDVMARFTTRLTADQRRYPVLLGNGNPGERETLPDGYHRITWEDPFAKPCYLFALVAGDLHTESRSVVTGSGRRIALNLHVEPHNRNACDWALEVLQRAIAWDEEQYGREYDLDVFNMVAVSQYTMGAMENKGLNIFNDRRVLAHPETATDRDLREIEALVAHEYLHNWTGNRVTCRDWFQLGLKEGLTVFREQQFVAAQGFAAVRRLEDMERLRALQFAEDAGPLAHPVRPDSYEEIDNFYSETVYNKGAELVRMIQRLVGMDSFRRGTEIFLARHDGHAVTVEAFLECMSEASGRDLSRFLRWYDRPGTPELFVSDRFDVDRGVYELRVRQRSAGREPLWVPLLVELLDEQGNVLAAESAQATSHITGQGYLLELTEREQCFCFTGVGTRPVPSLLRDFSAPVELHQERTPEQLSCLMVHDNDACVRRDALVRLAGRALLARAGGGREDGVARVLVAGFRQLLESGDDPAVLAWLLTLPEAAGLAGGAGAPDLEALDGVRSGLMQEIGAALETVFRRCHEVQPPDGRDPAAMGWRALRNTCLAWLVAAGEDGQRLAVQQYQDADNMTDRLAALEELVGVGGEDAGQALADFERRWFDHAFVMDRWFAVQARSGRDTIPRLTALMNHPLFSLDQPSRVRALVETFCAENPVAFHRADGSGYRFVVRRICEIDPRNPQLAAGLTRYLADAGRFGRERARAAGRELLPVRALPGLSRGTRELVESITTGLAPEHE